MNGPEAHPHDEKRSDPCPQCPTGNVTEKRTLESLHVVYECDTCPFKIIDTSKSMRDE